MKSLGIIFLVILLITIVSCSVRVCPGPVINHCHIECYDVCCDYNGCWDCDCHRVCYDDCVYEQPDGGK